jgi:hypothetical protein
MEAKEKEADKQDEEEEEGTYLTDIPLIIEVVYIVFISFGQHVTNILPGIILFSYLTDFSYFPQ